MVTTNPPKRAQAQKPEETPMLSLLLAAIIFISPAQAEETDSTNAPTTEAPWGPTKKALVLGGWGLTATSLITSIAVTGPMRVEDLEEARSLGRRTDEMRRESRTIPYTTIGAGVGIATSLVGIMLPTKKNASASPSGLTVAATPTGFAVAWDF